MLYAKSLSLQLAYRTGMFLVQHSPDTSSLGQDNDQFQFI